MTPFDVMYTMSCYIGPCRKGTRLYKVVLYLAVRKGKLSLVQIPYPSVDYFLPKINSQFYFLAGILNQGSLFDEKL